MHFTLVLRPCRSPLFPSFAIHNHCTRRCLQNASGVSALNTECTRPLKNPYKSIFPSPIHHGCNTEVHLLDFPCLFEQPQGVGHTLFIVNCARSFGLISVCRYPFEGWLCPVCARVKSRLRRSAWNGGHGAAAQRQMADANAPRWPWALKGAPENISKHLTKDKQMRAQSLRHRKYLLA